MRTHKLLLLCNGCAAAHFSTRLLRSIQDAGAAAPAELRSLY
jgi:hypothetical protein